VDEVEEQTTTPTEARPDIRQRMSSLNLDQQEAQDTRPYNLGSASHHLKEAACHRHDLGQILKIRSSYLQK
jgi:hypothetical protein